MARKKQNSKRQNIQNTGTRILEAAERVFAEKGLRGARVNEIAALARATPSLIHYHYGDKETLYKTVIENFYLSVERRLFPILMRETDARTKLNQLIVTGIELMAEKDHMARILLRESLDNGKYVNEVLSKPYLREMFEVTEQMVFSKMEPEGDGESDAMHLTCNLFGVVTMFFITASTIKEFWNRDVFSKRMIEERKEKVIDFVFHGIDHRFKGENRGKESRSGIRGQGSGPVPRPPGPDELDATHVRRGKDG